MTRTRRLIGAGLSAIALAALCSGCRSSQAGGAQATPPGTSPAASTPGGQPMVDEKPVMPGAGPQAQGGK